VGKVTYMWALPGGEVPAVARTLHAERRAIAVQTDMTDDDGRGVAQETQMQAVITETT
jgi:1,4-dihydroxy-2-naphthoyl-CoA hydrolase